MFRPFGFVFSSSSHHYITTILLEVAKRLLQNRSCQRPDGAIAVSVVAIRQKRAEFELFWSAFSRSMKIDIEKLAERCGWHVAQTKHMGHPIDLNLVSNCWLHFCATTTTKLRELCKAEKGFFVLPHQMAKWNGLKNAMHAGKWILCAGKTTMWRMETRSMHLTS